MAFDLIIRNARIHDAAAGAADAAAPSQSMDIGIRDGAIAALEPNLAGDGETVDVAGGLVTPGLIESHIHLDKSRILDRTEPAPDRGRDHMQRVSAVKPGFTVEDVYARARETLEQCILHGTTHIRTHVELDPNVGMVSFVALKKLADDYRWAVDMDLCVFAQEGWSTVPEMDRNIVSALQHGARVVGGAPAYDEDRPWQINRIFELAVEYGVDVDIHLDVGTSTDELDIHQVCELTDKHGYGGRVSIGHGTKYSALPPDELAQLSRRMADAGVAIAVLPATDLYVMGRERDHNIVRGVADANAMLHEGVNCCLSTNNVLNPFTPFGDCSLMRIANLYANTAQRGRSEELAECFQMISAGPARLIGLQDYGIAVGCAADLVVWDADSAADAVATIAHPRYGFKRGRRTFTRTQPELHRP